MPVKSEAQRRAMWAAREGHSTLGIPPSVGKKFVGPGRDAAKDMEPTDWRGLIKGLIKFFTEEAEEPEHAQDASGSPFQYAKAKIQAGRFPDINIQEVAGSYYLSDGNWSIFSGWRSYPNRSEAERDLSRIYDRANKFIGKDAQISAAGIIFTDPENNALFLKRSAKGDHPNEYCFPGGVIEEGEDAETAARREATEELGILPKWDLDPVHRAESDEGVDFTTFQQSVGEQFEPKLNDEHDDYVWAPLDNPPDPLHPGVAAVLSQDEVCNTLGSKCKPLPSSNPQARPTGTEGQEDDDSDGGMDCEATTYTARDGKLSHTEVAYVSDGKPESHCGICQFFHDQGCELVVDPIVREGWCKLFTADSEDATTAMDEKVLQLAMDRCIAASGGGEKYALDYAKESVREYDADGHLHIKRTPISKANVCPYIGEEIPDYEKLNLDPKKVYHLLRDPKELEAAAVTSNGKPFMRKHEPVSADDHKPYDVIGATGNDAEFEDPYLYNSVVVWPQEDIDKIESGDKVQLSSGYRYVADMTPGTFKGTPFDGVMRNIIFNHLASVEEGRAGKDVRVLDSVNPNVGWAAIEQAILGMDTFKESEHPRGQPENSGQFGSQGGQSKKVKSEETPFSANMGKAKPLDNKTRIKLAQKTGAKVVSLKGKLYGIERTFRQITDGLRQNNLSSKAKQEVSELDNLLDSSEVKEPFVAYRGAGEEVMRKLVEEGEGFEFTDKSFTATTVDPAIANAFGEFWANSGKTKNGERYYENAVLQINIPKGQKGAFVTTNSQADVKSWAKGATYKEAEFLLPRNTKFRISSIKKLSDTQTNSLGTVHSDKHVVFVDIVSENSVNLDVGLRKVQTLNLDFIA